MKTTIVSYSELDTYRQCPLKHQLSYRQRWTKPAQEGRALARGSLWHKVMELHYLALQIAQESTPGWSIPANVEAQTLNTIWQTVIRPLLSDPATGEQTPDQALIEWMYRGYIKMWGADRDWQILEVERTGFAPLPAESGRDSSRYRLKVKMDLLVRDRMGQIWLVDHKSCSELPTKLELDIDDQFGLYTGALRRLGWKVYGSIHSAARTRQLKGDEDGTKPTELERRFLRTPIYRTDTELDNLLMDAARTARAAYATTSQAPHSSPSSDRCKWRCDYLDAHLMMRKGVKPSVALQDFGFRIDPTGH